MTVCRIHSGSRKASRASVCLAIVGLALLVLPGVALAAPTVAFKLEAVPIPGFPHTGNIAGAGTDAALELVIKGAEYFDSPPPIVGADFYVPKGIGLHPAGFPTCAEATLVEVGPSGCPRHSKAGPVGTALGFVTFGGQRVDETAELIPFFSPGGGLVYFAEGHTPVVVEALTKAHFRRIAGIDGYGLEEEEVEPLIASVPDGPYVSIETIKGTFGAATRSHGKPIYYFRLPKTCPKGGFAAKVEVIFAENGEPSKPERVTALDKAPCPRRR